MMARAYKEFFYNLRFVSGLDRLRPYNVGVVSITPCGDL